MRVRIKYVQDWCSGDDQKGHITVTTETGTIEGTWSSTGGMGDGAKLVTNTTKEFDDKEADLLLNSAELCQGNGEYDADIVASEYGGHNLDNVTWIG